MNYEAGKYNGRKWAVFCCKSRTWIFTKGGRRGAVKKAQELNNYK